MPSTSFAHRFARSRVGPPVFFTLMAICAGIAFWTFRQTFLSTGISGSDFNFIAIVVLVCWGLVTRQFSFWTRWVVPLTAYAVCLWLSGEAARHLRLSSVQGDQELKAMLFLAGFFLFSLLWIVLIPVEEASYRSGAVPRGQLRGWPLGIGVVGLAMIALAGLIFVNQLESYSQHPQVRGLVAARNVVIYLSFAFCGLVLARVLLPIIRSKAVGTQTGLEPRTEGLDT
jgi:hypothetical protein